MSPQLNIDSPKVKMKQPVYLTAQIYEAFILVQGDFMTKTMKPKQWHYIKSEFIVCMKDKSHIFTYKYVIF